ncbi:MAG: hypothetical protein MJK08_09985 [Campylobacterales bacterium]|nr:hypothetical protein [Campylobacterales bacterium]NQY54407.1 hypothetical protein [Campylobacteraceae bacterium]
MRTRQYSVKVCEMTLTNENEFISFFDINHELFKDYLIVINGQSSQKILDYLDEKDIKYLFNVSLPKSQGRITAEKVIQEQQEIHEIKQKEITEELSKLSNRLHNNLKVRDTLVRSGQELNIKGDLLLLNRVNSGATINIDGNLIITQIVDGLIKCNGNFMIIKTSEKANILFHQQEIGYESLMDRLNKIEFIDNKIVITPISKETNWVS